MGRKYDLDELLKTPDRPLTRGLWNNFDRYIRMTNDDFALAHVLYFIEREFFK